MTVIDDAILKSYRTPGKCEGCGRWGDGCAHHLWTRGAGGGTRLDVPCFLMRLLLPFGCDCHNLAHCHEDFAQSLREKAAKREKVHPNDLAEAWAVVVWRVPKGASDLAVEHALGGLGAEVRRLVWQCVAAYRRINGEP